VWYAVNGAIGLTIMVTGVFSALVDLSESAVDFGFRAGECSTVHEDDTRYRGCSGKG
jgi:hypothetical protein